MLKGMQGWVLNKAVMSMKTSQSGFTFDSKRQSFAHESMKYFFVSFLTVKGVANFVNIHGHLGLNQLLKNVGFLNQKM